MTKEFAQLVLFYVLVALSLFVMSLSILHFPFIDDAQKEVYFDLSVSVQLFTLPLFFMASMLGLASK